MGSRVLIVDDEEPIRRLLSRVLEEAHYVVSTAADGQEAWEQIEDCPVDLVLADVRMPRLSGMELLQRIVQRDDDIAVVFLTACEDLPMAVHAMKLGAEDYLVKPVRIEQVTEAIKAALARRDDRLAAKILAAEQAVELVRFRGRLQEATQETLELLAAILDAREKETSNHSKRVSEFTVRLGREMGLKEEELQTLARGALLHDVGKIGIPDAILCKPTELTAEEREEMQKHPQIGYRILQSISSLRSAAEMVLAHHANFDGTGYPVHWKGDRIPLGSRIFAVADSFDAMTSDRPYRSQLSYEEACREILRCSGTQFDPAVVAAFLRISPEEWEAIRRSLPSSVEVGGAARIR